ncbi:hypothetical protein SS50377_21549 [Spironucleus salmonicida]|uniref:Uncharacterized protein n=1 Tax=Spironucleus salmonicida TaxID=348837 RepID=V6LFX1_9EUKA|nr:hypothetical protein SS50377_21549 [Spironucleus salmonicida]|eukprot:EST43407.1 Hypothetical protein SS50377_16902 [Spironucleus salmonicida]
MAKKYYQHCANGDEISCKFCSSQQRKPRRSKYQMRKVHVCLCRRQERFVDALCDQLRQEWRQVCQVENCQTCSMDIKMCVTCINNLVSNGGKCEVCRDNRSECMDKLCHIGKMQINTKAASGILTLREFLRALSTWVDFSGLKLWVSVFVPLAWIGEQSAHQQRWARPVRALIARSVLLIRIAAVRVRLATSSLAGNASWSATLTMPSALPTKSAQAPTKPTKRTIRAVRVQQPTAKAALLALLQMAAHAARALKAALIALETRTCAAYARTAISASTGPASRAKRTLPRSSNALGQLTAQLAIPLSQVHAVPASLSIKYQLEAHALPHLNVLVTPICPIQQRQYVRC